MTGISNGEARDILIRATLLLADSILHIHAIL